MSAPTVFHLAVPVADLEKAQAFYQDVLGAETGRRSHRWIDFNFFGHQLTCHLISSEPRPIDKGQVEAKEVPIPHFGPIVAVQVFKELKRKLKKQGVEFLLEPQTRFKNEDFEHLTMFFKDPFGNCIEIKSYTKEAEY